MRERGLDAVVHFLGRKTSAEIAALLQHSDFFLLFSNFENQPCVLLESFCTGTPAVTTPVGGIPEFTNPDNAVIVTPKDEAQLVEKMNDLLENAGNCKPAVIRNQALEICSADVVGNKWLAIYRTL